MEPKKTQKASLTNKTALFFNIGLVITLLIANMAFTYKVFDDTDRRDLGNINSPFDETVDIPITVQPPPPPPAVKLPQLIEVEDDDEIIDELDIDMDSEISDESIVEPVVISIPEPEKENIEEIFIIVEESATFKGGMNAFYKYVGKKLAGKYPAQARRMGIDGKVFVEFVVNRDGSIQDVSVVKGIGGGCDELAAKVIQESPAWKPGKQRGNAVRQRMMIQITFQLD